MRDTSGRTAFHYEGPSELESYADTGANVNDGLATLNLALDPEVRKLLTERMLKWARAWDSVHPEASADILFGSYLIAINHLSALFSAENSRKKSNEMEAKVHCNYRPA